MKFATTLIGAVSAVAVKDGYELEEYEHTHVSYSTET